MKAQLTESPMHAKRQQLVESVGQCAPVLLFPVRVLLAGFSIFSTAVGSVRISCKVP